MQKTEYITQYILNINNISQTEYYHMTLFFCGKRLNASHYLIMNIHDKRELKSIAVNHSADSDYEGFMKIESHM